MWFSLIRVIMAESAAPRIILTTSDDWLSFWKETKRYASNLEVLDYMDPSLSIVATAVAPDGAAGQARVLLQIPALGQKLPDNSILDVNDVKIIRKNLKELGIWIR